MSSILDRGKKVGITEILLFLALFMFVICWIFPFILNIFTSFKTEQEFGLSPLGIPRHPTLQAYKDAWNEAHFGTLFKNSFILTGFAVPASVFLASLPSYAFARLRLPGANIAFFLILGGLMIPPQITLVPLFDLMRRIYLLDSLVGLILIHTVLGLPMCTFILTGFFKAIPQDLGDAARIDGCSSFGIYWHLIMPLSKHALATMAVFQFAWIWNELLYGLVFINTQSRFPVPMGLIRFTGQHEISWNTPASSIIMASTPMVILYIVFHRYLVRGILSGSLKG